MVDSRSRSEVGVGVGVKKQEDKWKLDLARVIIAKGEDRSEERRTDGEQTVR